MKSHLHTGDCLDWLPTIDGVADLVFADPPFNIGYTYDTYRDNRKSSDYLEWCRRWIEGLHAALTPTGTLWIAIGDEYAAELCLIAKRAGFTLRNWCIWHYTFGVHLRAKFGRSKTHMLYFVKDSKHFTWNPDAVRIESARQRTGDKRADPRGRVPPDVWTASRICGTFKERTGHPCQMPEAILRRIVRACSNPGDTVADPFAGSGTTLAAALKENRNAVGCELSPEYADAIRIRLKSIPTMETANV